MFKINDTVVCIDASAGKVLPNGAPNKWTGRTHPFLVKGRTYKVEETFEIMGESALRIVGLAPSVGAHRFRLVSEVQAENRATRKERQPH